MKIVLWCTLLCLLSACAEGHCRRKTDDAVKPVEEPAPPQPAEVSRGKSDRVMVYKYDGSLQCGRGKAQSPEAMEKQLQGITVYSRAKKPDGLMHIQACGTITGQANVYEIPASSLKDAEKKGFKVWSFE